MQQLLILAEEIVRLRNRLQTLEAEFFRLAGEERPVTSTAPAAPAPEAALLAAATPALTKRRKIVRVDDRAPALVVGVATPAVSPATPAVNAAVLDKVRAAVHTKPKAAWTVPELERALKPLAAPVIHAALRQLAQTPGSGVARVKQGRYRAR